MRAAQTCARSLDDLSDIEDEFAYSVVEGLSKARKTLPCRYFYDARGSELFEEITRLPEYYPTRTEAGILTAHAAEIVAGIGEGGLLVEFGSGSSLKTEILLDRIAARVAYVPIDVSEAALVDAKARLARRYPSLDVRPDRCGFLRSHNAARRSCGSSENRLLPRLDDRQPCAYTMRSTCWLRSAASSAKVAVSSSASTSRRIPRTLVRAYNDAAGVTAAFNLNLLATHQSRAWQHVRRSRLPARSDLRSSRGTD